MNNDPNKPDAKKPHDVVIHCDYISADHPIVEKFPATTTVGAIKQWAREQFVPNPPSDKAYWLNDDKTHHRFTDAEEALSLEKLGYEKEAKFRLNEEQRSGHSR